MLTSDDTFKVLHLTGHLVNVVQPRNLNQPSDIVRVEFVMDDPFSELVPFVWGAAIDTDPPLAILRHLSWHNGHAVGRT